MANKKEENKETKETKANKTNLSKKTTSKKSNSTKKQASSKTTTKKTTPKQQSSKTTTKKTSTSKKKTTNNSKKVITKKSTTKTTPNKEVIEKDLEKTIIIEDIENKINDIVENKKVNIKEQVIEDIKFEEVAKLENAKYGRKKSNKPLLAIGVIISLLGIIALIITLIANRIVDKEFISDNAIVLMVIASILIECFGAFIIINES